MQLFKQWLEAEFDRTVNTLKSIPSGNRKGFEVALHRKRARDTETTIKLLAEFEMSITDLSPS